jgi:uncharacterized protein YcbK (DUF882 family)/LysM repeat protein
VRSPLTLSLVCGAGLLLVQSAFAAGKAPMQTQSVGSGRQDEKTKSAPPPVAASVQIHRVQRGEKLRDIASRYAAPETALMTLNGLASDEPIRPGQILFVPSHDKTPPARSAPSSAPSSAPWRRYVKTPKEPGHIDLSTHAARFVGSVVDKQGALRPAAVRALNNLLAAGGKHPPLPERLVRLLVKVSDTFGGRSIHVVSGYRTNSYYQDSRHRLSAAVDFAVADVPNTILCEYLRELDDVGVGYYPNSNFVHLDVRKQSTYWVDYAGPGEPPRSTPNAPRPAHGSKRWLLAELDNLVNRTKKALERSGTESLRDVPVPTTPRLEAPPVDHQQPPALGDAVASSRSSAEPVSL